MRKFFRWFTDYFTALSTPELDGEREAERARKAAAECEVYTDDTAVYHYWNRAKVGWRTNDRPFPHCDEDVLHGPDAGCQVCDKAAGLQLIRRFFGINFTGEDDLNKAVCPAEVRRSLVNIENWPGNRPYTESEDDIEMSIKMLDFEFTN